jgi:MFS family permease
VKYTPNKSGFGLTGMAFGRAIAATVAGRWVNRLGRPVVLIALGGFAVGAVLIDLVVRTGPGTRAAILLAGPLFVLGAGSGGVITPNQTLSLQRIDSRMGGTAAGILQTSQRIGAAVGQAVIGAVFFASLPDGIATLDGASRDHAYGHAVSNAVLITLVFVAAALALSAVELAHHKRTGTAGGPPPAKPST